MRMLNLFSLAAALLLCSIGTAGAQDCGCANGEVGSGTVGGHRHFWPGPYGGPNCGRAYTQAQAESLWSGYCSEDCSLCGHGCGKGLGFLGHSTSAGNGCGAARGGCGPFASPAGVHAGRLFGAGHADSCGAAPGPMGGKAFGRSIFGCQQLGSGNCSAGCGCGGSDSGSGGLCGHFREIGCSGRLFRSSECDSGCDNAGCDSGSAGTAAAPSPPHQSATPVRFHRYHSGK